MSYMGFPRQDENDQFVRLEDGVTVVWRVSPTSIYHASVDGLVPICQSRVVLTDDGPSSCYDRSDNIMTCKHCEALVRRISMLSPAELEERRQRALKSAADRAKLVSEEALNSTACSSGRVMR